ncbi:MAG: hypothetical protein AABY07_06285 [Nanoarchaeota archaeon]|mgnify:FL=1
MLKDKKELLLLFIILIFINLSIVYAEVYVTRAVYQPPVFEDDAVVPPTVQEDIGVGCTIGPWQITTPISFSSGGVQGAAAVAHNNFLYLTGGQYGSNQFSNRIQRATINPDGSLGNWIDLGSGICPAGQSCALPFGLQDHKAVVYQHPLGTNPFLYIIGGSSRTSVGAPQNGPQRIVRYARINPDGSLSLWNIGPNLDQRRFEHGAAIANNRMYVFGGSSGADLSSVEYVTINPDGSLTGDASNTWITTQLLPQPLNFLAGGTNNGMLYAVGGESIALCPTTTQDEIYRATPDISGAIISWQLIGSLPELLADHGINLFQNFIFVTGGVLRQYSSPICTSCLIIQASDNV